MECICICEDKSKYKVPALATDAVLINEDNKVLLIRRMNEPFKGSWALPGGFISEGEKVEKAIKREVSEETNLNMEVKEIVGVYSDPDRDPRGHVVSIVFYGSFSGSPEPDSDACEVELFHPEDLPDLAFDHGEILKHFFKEVN